MINTLASTPSIEVERDLDWFANEIELAISRALNKISLRSLGQLIPDFDIRGELYKLALDLAPNARRQDIDLMMEWIVPIEGEIGVDLAAGTGFLTKHLIAYTNKPILAVDPSREQLKEAVASHSSLIIPVCCSPDETSLFDHISPHSIDFVTSFGGIHHMSDHLQLFKNVSKILSPTGRFIAADVCSGTRLSEHFDQIVATKCITGHSANWLNEAKVSELTAVSSLQLIRSERVNLKWCFESEKQLALFFKGLHAYNMPLNEIIADLKSTLGVIEQNGKLWLNWPLLVFDIRNKPYLVRN